MFQQEAALQEDAGSAFSTETFQDIAFFCILPQHSSPASANSGSQRLMFYKEEISRYAARLPFPVAFSSLVFCQHFRGRASLCFDMIRALEFALERSE